MFSDKRLRRKPLVVDCNGSIRSLVFLVGQRHVFTGGVDGKIRRWRVDDGEQVDVPIDAWSTVCALAVSPDSKWLVSGTNSGQVTLWHADTRQKAVALAGHQDWVRAVDVSPDASRIATGSYDKTCCVWDLDTGDRLLGPLQHDWSLAAVRFSPDGRLFATATWCRPSVRIYNYDDGRLLVDFPVQVSSSENQSLAWTTDAKHLFALSRDGHVHHLDVHDGTVLSKWPIHGSSNARCIALASDDHVIAASAGSSVSLWNTTTHSQIGPLIQHPALVVAVAISPNLDLVIGGGEQISLRNIHDVVRSSDTEHTSTVRLLCRLLHIFPEQDVRRTRVDNEATRDSPHTHEDSASTSGHK